MKYFSPSILFDFVYLESKIVALKKESKHRSALEGAIGAYTSAEQVH